MKKLLQFILKVLAKATITRYRPLIVGVTGSVGKTGSRTAIVAVLQQRWRVFEPKKNLNNEIGLPLTVLGEGDSGYRQPGLWLKIFFRAIKQIIIKNPNYPEVLVLEYGIDHAGDMDYLLTIAQPRVSVITAVSETHLEFLKTIEGVAKEKAKLVSCLPTTGVAVLNCDFPLVLNMKNQTKAKVFGYGEADMAQVKTQGVKISQSADGQIQGMSFRLTVGGSTVPVLIKEVVGKPVVSMAAAGAAVGQALGLTGLEITRGLSSFVPPAGRLRLLRGIGNTIIIDDTYNSSPQALVEALNILAELPVTKEVRRWAVLGDMLELGSNSAALHQDLGRLIAEKKVDYLITIGDMARHLQQGARAAGLAHNCSWQFDDFGAAVKYIKETIQSGDIILIKASQGLRFEGLVKELMLEPAKAKELLVRQTPPWV